MKTYPIVISNSHILLDIDNGPILVDTGSPINFNRNAHMELNGVGYSMPESVANVDADYITSHVGRDTAGMVGTGILGSYDFTIDTRAGEMTFDALGKSGPLPIGSLTADRVRDALSEAQRVASRSVSYLGSKGMIHNRNKE